MPQRETYVRPSLPRQSRGATLPRASRSTTVADVGQDDGSPLGMVSLLRAVHRWRQAAWRVVLAVGLAGSAVPAVAAAWSARKAPSVAPRSKPSQGPRKPTTGSAVTPPSGALPQAPLEVRVEAAVGARPPRPATLLTLLREASQARETALQMRLVTALQGCAAVTTVQWMEAAQLLAATDANSRALWQRAWQGGARHPALARQIAEGYADALLAVNDTEQAARVVEQALQRTPPGQRRGLYERLAAIARMQGDLDARIDSLVALDDPDAALVGAQLQAERGDDEAAATTLQGAWQRYRGNRALQAAYVQLLLRLGRREVLHQVTEEVVRLAPADPMPLVAVLDAHIAARDNRAAWTLLDDLLRRYPRHDVLIESLIDRAQRLGGADERVTALYRQLLAAAPNEAQYIESFGEWLLARGDTVSAMTVLAALANVPGKKLDGQIREAELLLGHKLVKPMQTVLGQLAATAPDDPRVRRLQAQLAELQGNPAEAERRWLELTRLDTDATPTERRRATDARQALIGLYRRNDWTAQRRRTLWQQAREGAVQLGSALLLLDIQQQFDPQTTDGAAWASLASELRRQLGADAELLTALATVLISHDQHEATLPLLVELRAADRDAAEPLLQQLLEAGLARRLTTLAHRVEAELAPPPPAQVSVTALLRLGDLYQRHGDTAGAAALFRRAAQSAPADMRAAARLAALYRQAGQRSEEEAVLRDIVQRSADPDELELAGQRLVTVALGSGRSADLVRWLDAVMPQHPRREALARFRSTAYDVWLRTVPLDEALGQGGAAPLAGATGEALGSGDLALQARALRQLARARRMPAASVARQLLASPNASVRRDTALVLGACGSAEAAALLRDVMSEGLDADEEVIAAEVAALMQLPAVPGLDPPLLSLAARHDWHLAVLALGRSGGGDAVFDLVRRVQTPRGGVPQRDEWVAPVGKGQAADWLALGATAARMADDPRVTLARQTILDAAARIGPGSADVARQVAILWALRAIGHVRTGVELARVAVSADQAVVREAAVLLLTSDDAPRLEVPLPPVGQADAVRALRSRAVRDLLTPWLGGDNSRLQVALRRGGTQLAVAWESAQQARTAALGADAAAQWRTTWCQDWGAAIPADLPVWQTLCATTTPAPSSPR